jgi:hypothetical protein
MSNSNHHEQTLAEYKAMINKVDQQARDRLAKVLQTIDDDDVDDTNDAEEK